MQGKTRRKGKGGKVDPAKAWIRPKQAAGGPVRVVDPEAEERRLIQRLREIARG